MFVVRRGAVIETDCCADVRWTLTQGGVECRVKLYAAKGRRSFADDCALNPRAADITATM